MKMFSFHKPKIYRSISGCCICKAKSSSSRFTDSKKYENEFERCFRTNDKRTGEICNACVLLVKRWKKLPPGTQRDWRHVVDARAGPGATKSLKPMTSSPNGKQSNSTTNTLSLVSHKRPSKPKKLHASDDIMMVDDSLVEDSPVLSRIMSPERSDDSDLDDEDYLSENGFNEDEPSGKRKLRSRSSSKASRKCNASDVTGKRTAAKLAMKCVKNTSSISSFLDMSFWRKEKICCGIIFTGPDNEVVIYPKLLKPCSCRRGSAASSDGKVSISDHLSVDLSIPSSSPIEDDTNSNASSLNSFI